MLSPISAKIASDVANECIDKIMYFRKKDGTSADRPLEQITLIGDIILTTIAAVQAEESEGGEASEASSD